MATTALFAEILIVGLQAEAVLALLLVALFGDAWIDLAALADWTTLVTVLVLAAAYVLGILVDRMADSAWRRFSRQEEVPGEALMRLRVLAAGGGLAGFLEYQRSRLRIARGTVLTSAVAVLVAPAAMLRLGAGWTDVAVTVAFVAALLVASVFVARRIHRAYINRLLDANRLLAEGA